MNPIRLWIRKNPRIHTPMLRLYISIKRLFQQIALRTIFPFFGSLGFLSALFYSLFSRAFYNEHKAALKGLMAYRSREIGKETNLYMIRRNIHRIEKGLIMRPRRDVFAADYILLTIKKLLVLLRTCNEEKHRKQLNWFADVLKEYFIAVNTDDHRIAPAYKLFKSLEFNQDKSSGTASAPYVYKKINKPEMDYEAFLTLVKNRTSVRWYLNKRVSRNIIDSAIEAGAQSPSACNRQPFRFVVYDDPKEASKMAGIPAGTRGFDSNIPGVIIVVGSLGAFGNERDRHIIYIDASLASMSIILALEMQGVNSCILNWPDIASKERELSKHIKLKSYERAIMFIAFGYADPEGLVPFSQKKTLDELREYSE